VTSVLFPESGNREIWILALANQDKPHVGNIDIIATKIEREASAHVMEVVSHHGAASVAV
jgi:hypothetical protein